MKGTAAMLTRTTPSSGAPCVPGDCAAEFKSLEEGLDTIKRNVRDTSARMEPLERALGSMGERVGAVGERTARVEEATEALRGDVRALASQLNALPGELSLAVRAHGQDCPGRALAMDRITTNIKRTPAGGSYPPSAAPANIPVPRWLLWLGGAIGAAVVGAGYGLAQILGTIAGK